MNAIIVKFQMSDRRTNQRCLLLPSVQGEYTLCAILQKGLPIHPTGVGCPMDENPETLFVDTFPNVLI